MYWLKINNGNVGPFASKKNALDRYRTYVQQMRIYMAQLWTGSEKCPITMEYVII